MNIEFIMNLDYMKIFFPKLCSLPHFLLESLDTSFILVIAIQSLWELSLLCCFHVVGRANDGAPNFSGHVVTQSDFLLGF